MPLNYFSDKSAAEMKSRDFGGKSKQIKNLSRDYFDKLKAFDDMLAGNNTWSDENMKDRYAETTASLKALTDEIRKQSERDPKKTAQNEALLKSLADNQARMDKLKAHSDSMLAMTPSVLKDPVNFADASYTYCQQAMIGKKAAMEQDMPDNVEQRLAVHSDVIKRNKDLSDRTTQTMEIFSETSPEINKRVKFQELYLSGMTAVDDNKFLANTTNSVIKGQPDKIKYQDYLDAVKIKKNQTLDLSKMEQLGSGALNKVYKNDGKVVKEGISLVDLATMKSKSGDDVENTFLSQVGFSPKDAVKRGDSHYVDNVYRHQATQAVNALLGSNVIVESSIEADVKKGSVISMNLAPGVPAAYAGENVKDGIRITMEDMKSPDIQKQCQELAAIDFITGQGDRHAGNFYIDKKMVDGVPKLQITGIDNDYSLHTVNTDGEKVTSTKGVNFMNVTTLGSSFPLITPELKTKINSITDKQLENTLMAYAQDSKGAERIAAAKERLQALKVHVNDPEKCKVEPAYTDKTAATLNNQRLTFFSPYARLAKSVENNTKEEAEMSKPAEKHAKKHAKKHAEEPAKKPTLKRK